MQGTVWRLERGILAMLYADDMVGISFTADGLQCGIVDPCAQYARRHRYRANVPKCGVMVCGPTALVQGLPARAFTWGQTEIPMVSEMKHLGITITLNGRPDAQIKQVITQGKTRVLQMGKLLRDKIAAPTTPTIPRYLCITNAVFELPPTFFLKRVPDVLALHPYSPSSILLFFLFSTEYGDMVNRRSQEWTPPPSRAAMSPGRLHAGKPAIQSIHACAMQGLDQALTANIGVGFLKPANDVKIGCGRANPCVEVAKDNYQPLLLEPEDVLHQRCIVPLLLCCRNGRHIHAAHVQTPFPPVACDTKPQTFWMSRTLALLNLW